LHEATRSLRKRQQALALAEQALLVHQKVRCAAASRALWWHALRKCCL
jgi:hypothetical protein